MDTTQTWVTFKSSAFNMEEPKESYFHPNNFGDDVAMWLRRKLSQAGYSVSQRVGQEDHGWYFTFEVGGQPHDFIVGYRGEEEWPGWVERKAGLLASLLGARRRGVQAEAVQAIDGVLSAADDIREVRWHSESSISRE